MNLTKTLRTVPFAVALAMAPCLLAQEASSDAAGQQDPPAAETKPQQTPPAGQESAQQTPPANPLDQEPPGGKRVLGVLPNYRTASADLEGTTLTAKQKMTIAAKDSFDYPLALLAAAYAGLDQLTDSDPSYGQGMEGYAKRFGAWYADEAIGNMFTEGVFPSLFHQDPRYFRRGPQWGGAWKRTGYALAQVVVTHKDGGGYQFNYSEWVGNAAATAIGNIYHVDDRNASSNAYKLLEQVGTDAVSQVIKEFWPDLKKKWFHKGSG
jgi:hypothetical protein